MIYDCRLTMDDLRKKLRIKNLELRKRGKGLTTSKIRCYGVVA